MIVNFCDTKAAARGVPPPMELVRVRVSTDAGGDGWGEMAIAT
jgi:hypothetical protein